MTIPIYLTHGINLALSGPWSFGSSLRYMGVNLIGLMVRGNLLYLGNIMRHKISNKKRNIIAKRDKGICQVCGKTSHYCKWGNGYYVYYEIKTIFNDKYHFPFDIDHIVPISANGKTETNNLQLTCQQCNRSKGNRYEVV
jgi:hypothetical protein